ncbi:DUF4097 family beta strand repeat-containing protein [Streptomyces armeniacus]|nr:DUF4097 family beta strand repeat-containing protein [Streptomyces armeniacus]
MTTNDATTDAANGTSCPTAYGASYGTAYGTSYGTAPARRRTRRAARLALPCVALAVVTTAAGCGLMEDTKTGERAYSVSQRTSAVSVDTDGGDIDIVAGDPESDTVRVQERYEYSHSKPETQHSVRDGRLLLSADDCGGKNGGTCDVSYEIRVPPKTAVKVDTGGGTVTVRGTSGRVDALSEGGDIRIEESAARRVSAHTEGGEISTRFTGAPDSVDVTSAGGSIDVRLPGGPYAVDATTKGGERKVSVPSDGDAGQVVKAHTEGGDVTVRSSSGSGA